MYEYVIRHKQGRFYVENGSPLGDWVVSIDDATKVDPEKVDNVVHTLELSGIECYLIRLKR